jgi:beta-phosphoglucomutase-like phosphatase (HAD superfamily)
MMEAIIFDMDGLMVDSEPVWDQARKSMAAEVGKIWDKNDHKAIMGVSTQEWVDYMIRRLELTIPPQEVQDRIIERMVVLYQERIPFLPGALDAINLAVEHYPVALASGSPPNLVDTVMNHPDLKGKFQVILSADNIDGPGKPSPDVYLETARRMGTEPSNCLCLEDSTNGILAGKNAGMTVIAVPDERFPPKPDILAQADYVFSSLHEFNADFLSNLNEK